jgi:predicted NUDIX family NTP pyrophosphohydrolase
VVVTDGVRLLLGHASRSPRWDIPKGLADSGEPLLAAAVREMFEETGLQAGPNALQPLGTHAYLRHKDLALFAWRPKILPDQALLRCSSLVELPGGKTMPELDRFGLFELNAALAVVGVILRGCCPTFGLSLLVECEHVPFQDRSTSTCHSPINCWAASCEGVPQVVV